MSLQEHFQRRIQSVSARVRRSCLQAMCYGHGRVFGSDVPTPNGEDGDGLLVLGGKGGIHVSVSGDRQNTYEILLSVPAPWSATVACCSIEPPPHLYEEEKAPEASSGRERRPTRTASTVAKVAMVQGNELPPDPPDGDASEHIPVREMPEGMEGVMHLTNTVALEVPGCTVHRVVISGEQLSHTPFDAYVTPFILVSHRSGPRYIPGSVFVRFPTVVFERPGGEMPTEQFSVDRAGRMLVAKESTHPTCWYYDMQVEWYESMNLQRFLLFRAAHGEENVTSGVERQAKVEVASPSANERGKAVTEDKSQASPPPSPRRRSVPKWQDDFVFFSERSEEAIMLERSKRDVADDEQVGGSTETPPAQEAAPTRSQKVKDPVARCPVCEEPALGESKDLSKLPNTFRTARKGCEFIHVAPHDDRGVPFCVFRNCPRPYFLVRPTGDELIEHYEEHSKAKDQLLTYMLGQVASDRRRKRRASATLAPAEAIAQEEEEKEEKAASPPKTRAKRRLSGGPDRPSKRRKVSSEIEVLLARPAVQRTGILTADDVVVQHKNGSVSLRLDAVENLDHLPLDPKTFTQVCPVPSCALRIKFGQGNLKSHFRLKHEDVKLVGLPSQFHERVAAVGGVLKNKKRQAPATVTPKAQKGSKASKGKAAVEYTLEQLTPHLIDSIQASQLVRKGLHLRCPLRGCGLWIGGGLGNARSHVRRHYRLQLDGLDPYTPPKLLTRVNKGRGRRSSYEADSSESEMSGSDIVDDNSGDEVEEEMESDSEEEEEAEQEEEEAEEEQQEEEEMEVEEEEDATEDEEEPEEEVGSGMELTVDDEDTLLIDGLMLKATS